MQMVRIPGTERGRTTRNIAPSRLQPSTRAASVISRGTFLKKPIRSHVQKGIVNVGYTSASDHLLLLSPNPATSWESGRDESGGPSGSEKRWSGLAAAAERSPPSVPRLAHQSIVLAFRFRSRKRAPSSRTGKRKSDIVAPRPSEPATTPVWNAYDAMTWVAPTGFPRVISHTTVMSVNVNTREQGRAM